MLKEKKLKRITVKVGTRVLTSENNRIDEDVIKSISSDIADLLDEGMEVVLVTSGAIGSGLGLLDIAKKGRSLSELQAIASIGQNHLMDIYNEHLGKRGYRAGQILLTQEDLNDRKRFLNIRYTLNALLKYKALPIINENDSVSTEEIKFGDNDRLSSLVADLANSDLLIILTDVDGLYGRDGKVIDQVEEVTASVKALCGKKGCCESTGGMLSKLEAVKNATHAGIPCVIARGKRKGVIKEICSGQKRGTYFLSAERSINARKRWIAFGKKAKGEVEVDEGASEAISKKNRSLLPGGIAAIKGHFVQGDVVDITCRGRGVIARGLSNYSSDEIVKIKGRKTNEIEAVLGYKDYDEVVHRDNLVVMRDEG
jgi:glutamate 5-kinase